MSSSSDISVACGGGGSGKGDDEDKTCTSCEQKDVSDKVSDNTSSADIDADLDAINSFSRAALSDDELFKDPPPKEDCPLCMQPMPYSNNHTIYFHEKIYNQIVSSVLWKEIMPWVYVSSRRRNDRGKYKKSLPVLQSSYATYR